MRTSFLRLRSPPASSNLLGITLCCCQTIGIEKAEVAEIYLKKSWAFAIYEIFVDLSQRCDNNRGYFQEDLKMWVRNKVRFCCIYKFTSLRLAIMDFGFVSIFITIFQQNEPLTWLLIFHWSLFYVNLIFLFSCKKEKKRKIMEFSISVQTPASLAERWEKN